MTNEFTVNSQGEVQGPHGFIVSASKAPYPFELAYLLNLAVDNERKAVADASSRAKGGSK